MLRTLDTFCISNHRMNCWHRNIKSGFGIFAAMVYQF